MPGRNHTPGPWTEGSSHYDHSVWAQSGQMKICDMRGWGYLIGAGAMNLPPQEAAAIQDANKDLIMASPDLLYICEAILHEIETFKDWNWPPLGDIPDILRAAVAKAKRTQSL